MKIVELETPNSSESNHKTNEMRGDAPPTSATKHCSCIESKCLKLYCNCFARKEICTSACSCENCGNKVANFVSVEEGITYKGCNCKKSFCAKKYCECFQAGIGCSNDCKCVDCVNPNGARKVAFQSVNWKEQTATPPNTSNLSFQSPFNATPLNSAPAMKNSKDGRPSETSFEIVFTQRENQQDKTTAPNSSGSSYQAPLFIMPIQSVPGNISSPTVERPEAGFNSGRQKEKQAEVKPEKRPSSPEPEDNKRKRKSREKEVDSSVHNEDGSIHSRLVEIRTLLESQLQAQNVTNNLISKLTNTLSELNDKL